MKGHFVYVFGFDFQGETQLSPEGAKYETSEAVIKRAFGQFATRQRFHGRVPYGAVFAFRSAGAAKSALELKQLPPAPHFLLAYTGLRTVWARA